MEDLIRSNAASNAQAWYEKVPKDLPVLLVSGEEDPVGDYGSGVKNVAERLKAAGHTKVTVKLYPECRHEVLNETNRQEVMEDLLAWIGTVPETR
jgi:alpha-beta hydrolase superfamily lysophospholipase